MATIPPLTYNDYKKPSHGSDTFFLNNLRIAKSSNVMERLLQEATLSFHYQIAMEPTSVSNCWKHHGAVCSESCLQRPCHFPQHLWGTSVLVSYFPSKQNYLRNTCRCVLLPHTPGMSSDHLDLGKKKKKWAKNWQPCLPHHSSTNYILLSTLRNRCTNQENVQAFGWLGRPLIIQNPLWGVLRNLAAQKLPDKAIQSLKPPLKLG